jgi:hypothetical protein
VSTHGGEALQYEFIAVSMLDSTRKDLPKYLSDHIKGHFIGFIVGTSAARLVSTFFETRKLSNLWGLTARRSIVDHDTYIVLQWFCALVVGFIVFEIVNKLVKVKLDLHSKARFDKRVE